MKTSIPRDICRNEVTVSRNINIIVFLFLRQLDLQFASLAKETACMQHSRSWVIIVDVWFVL